MRIRTDGGGTGGWTAGEADGRGGGQADGRGTGGWTGGTASFVTKLNFKIKSAFC